MLTLLLLLAGCTGGSGTDTAEPDTTADRSTIALPDCSVGRCTVIEATVRDVAVDAQGGAWVLMAGLPPAELWPTDFTAPDHSGDFLVYFNADDTIQLIESVGSQVDASVQVSSTGHVLLNGSYRHLNLAGTDYDVPSNGTSAGRFLAWREPSGQWHVHQPWSGHHEVLWKAVTFNSSSDLVLIGLNPGGTDPSLFGHTVPSSERHQLLQLSLADGLISQQPVPEMLDSVGMPSQLWVRDEAIYGRTQTTYGGALTRLDGAHPWAATIEPWLGHNLFELHAEPDATGRVAVSVWVGNSAYPYQGGGLNWTSASGTTQEVPVTQLWQDWQSAWLTPQGEFETVDPVGGRGVTTHPSGTAWHPYIPNGGAYGAPAHPSEWCRLGSTGRDCTALAHDWAKIGADGSVWAWSRNYDVLNLEIRRP